MQPDLFQQDTHASDDWQRISVPEADLRLYPALFSSKESDQYLEQLQKEIQWSQQLVRLYGKTHLTPRLSAWYGDPGKSYTYSGLTMQPLAWSPLLSRIKQRVESVSRQQFNSVLLNLYRDGSDCVGWHSDDEKELGKEPVIASVSFGEPRPFQLKHKFKKDLKQSIGLPHGSLLIMQGKTQTHWLHQIARSKKIHRPRINLTFRQIIS